MFEFCFAFNKKFALDESQLLNYVAAVFSFKRSNVSDSPAPFLVFMQYSQQVTKKKKKRKKKNLTERWKLMSSLQLLQKCQVFGIRRSIPGGDASTEFFV